jgi:PhoU domain
LSTGAEQWKVQHFENGWSSKGAGSMVTSIPGGHEGHVMVTVHREARKTRVPLGGARQALDPRVVRQACEELGLDASQLPGPTSRVEGERLAMIVHTTRAFDTALQELARKIVDMGRLDDEQIAAATEALVKCDTALASRVIAADDRLDALQRDIEEKAIAIIARRQPMAVDLREIVGALRISNDLSGSAILPRTTRNG